MKTYTSAFLTSILVLAGFWAQGQTNVDTVNVQFKNIESKATFKSGELFIRNAEVSSVILPNDSVFIEIRDYSSNTILFKSRNLLDKPTTRISPTLVASYGLFGEAEWEKLPADTSYKLILGITKFQSTKIKLLVYIKRQNTIYRATAFFLTN